ncbi:MAG: transporter [Candidatus Omnitrophota bacterium]
MLRALFLILFLIIGSFRIDVFAQEELPEAWEPISAGPVMTWTAPLCAQGEFVLQPFFFYHRTRGVFDSQGHYDSLPESDKKYQVQQQLFMQYGLTDRIEIDAQILYQHNYVKQQDLKAHAHGLADTCLFLRYCVLEETTRIPHITGLLEAKFPTGKYENLDTDKLGTDSMGTGSYDYGFGIIASKKLKPFVLHADLTLNFPQEVKVNNMKTEYAPYVNYDLGVEYFLPKGFNFMLEFNGYFQGDTREEGEKVSSSDVRYLTVSPGIGWSNEKIQTLLVYQRTLSGVNTDVNDSVVLTCVLPF